MTTTGLTNMTPPTDAQNKWQQLPSNCGCHCGMMPSNNHASAWQPTMATSAVVGWHVM